MEACMPKLLATASLLLISLASPAWSAELFVSKSAPDGGDGTAAKPFNTIAAALKVYAGGDTITVKAGTYAESVVVNKSGTPEQPTVLRAAPGERVILSGFAAVTGWQQEGDGIYTATVEGVPTDLYVGLNPQPVSRWPGVDEPMRYAVDPNAEQQSVRDRDGLKDQTLAQAVAESPKSAMAFLYVVGGNYYTTVPVAKVDAAAGVLTFARPKVAETIQGKADRYQLVNHPALIRKPGQWAFDKIDDKQSRLYFRPADPADLQRTQFRRMANRVLLVGHFKDQVANVRIEGLEVCGSTKEGIQVGNSRNVTIANCVVHNNANNGIFARDCEDVVVRNNMVVANTTGVAILSARNAVVERNEIAANYVDGLVVAGTVSRQGGGRETDGAVVRRNYIHHHTLLGHPDNVQTYRGVKNLTLEDNVLLLGGQGVMTEETTNSTIRNTVIVGTAAVATIFGHGNADSWTVEGSTIGLGGWGLLSLTGSDYKLSRNVLWGGSVPNAEGLSSDHNVFVAPKGEPIFRVSKPQWRAYTEPSEAAAATGQEKHSVRVEESPLRNAPALQAVAPWHDGNTPGRLFLRPKVNAATLFEVGDRIEINGDGVARVVKSVDGESFTFEPALPVRPFRDSLVWNWKKAESFTLDVRPKEGTAPTTAGPDGKPAGASLNVADFEKGDFDGDGKRDIPEVPADLKQAWPNPNNVVLPLQGL
jgi:parallel beta-helix repeat protein